MKLLRILGIAIFVFTACEDNTTVTENAAVGQDSIVLNQKVKSGKTIQAVSYTHLTLPTTPYV